MSFDAYLAPDAPAGVTWGRATLSDRLVFSQIASAHGSPSAQDQTFDRRIRCNVQAGKKRSDPHRTNPRRIIDAIVK
jgi:hypothetical protein